MSDWDKRFMDLAAHVAQWSKDPSTKVGAVIVDHDRRVVGMGYNGFPRYVNDTERRLENRLVKYKLVVHAEANAILNAHSSLKGTTLYCTKFCCTDCTKLIIQSGISRVFAPEPGGNPVWIDDAEWSQVMLKEACVLWMKTPTLED